MFLLNFPMMLNVTKHIYEDRKSISMKAKRP